MNAKTFANALGEIGANYIAEAAAYKPTKKKNIRLKWAAAAACLALITAAGIWQSGTHHLDTPDDGIGSYFAITAQAANGETLELDTEHNYFNSGTSQGNVFGVDMPLFDFSVRPTDLKGNEALYSRFDIAVSYNGTLVGDKDPHVMVAYLIPLAGSDEPWSYSVSGWFEDPTDITVQILDKNSREIVETMTVHVEYLADKQGYDLKMTNLTTQFHQQKKAADATNALMEYFFRQGYVTEYPSYFGGCYVENDKLYVKLVSPSDEEKKRISDVLAPYGDTVVFEEAKRSMADLQAYADKTANELIAEGYAVTSWYVDSVTGNVVISVLEKDLAAVTAWIADTQKEADLPTVTVEKGAYVTLD